LAQKQLLQGQNCKRSQHISLRGSDGQFCVPLRLITDEWWTGSSAPLTLQTGYRWT